MEQEYKYMVCTSCMTYNHAPYIVDTMNGFTMQETTFPVYYLITDDASTDGEPEVIKQYLADHFQTPYRIEETEDYNLICANHNTNPNCTFIVFLLKYNHYSIKKSKLPYQTEWRDNTKYIAICEGDDYWTHSGKLQMQVDFLETHPDYGMCHTDFNTIGRRRVTPIRTTNDDNYWPSILTKGLRVGTVTVVMRTDIYISMPKLFLGKDWPIGDLPMWYEIARVSKIKYLPVVTATYRVLLESASHSNNLEKVLRYEEKKMELKRFYAKTYNVEVDERIWERQSYEIIIRFAARNRKADVAEKYYTEAKEKNIVSRKMLLYYFASKYSVLEWLLRKVHLL